MEELFYKGFNFLFRNESKYFGFALDINGGTCAKLDTFDNLIFAMLISVSNRITNLQYGPFVTDNPKTSQQF